MFRLTSRYLTIPKFRKLLGLAGCALFLLFNLLWPAEAQYYPYGNSASMLLWPLTAASYQLFGGSGYLLGNLLMRGSYSPYGYAPYGGNYGPNYYGYPQNPGPFGYNNGQYPNNSYGYSYTSQTPYGQNGQTLTGQGPASQWPNQNAYQQAPNQWNSSGINPGNNSANNPGNYPAANQGYSPVNNPINRPGVNPTSNNGTGNGSSSSFTGGNQPPSSGAIAAVPDRTDQKAPSPGVFIKFVVEKYNGDIYRALRDKEIYSWAESLNLVSPNSGYNHLMSADKSRRETIAKVLKDSTINPTYKIEILQILTRP